MAIRMLQQVPCQLLRMGWCHEKIVRRQSGRQPTSAPDQKEAKVLLALLENMKK